MKKAVRTGSFIAALILCAVSVWYLEAERASVRQSTITSDAGVLTLYEARDASGGPLVVVTHGFAGSVQMMQYLSRHLARAGFKVAAFDFYGHGRSETLLSPDVTRIEGTTRQLVLQTRDMMAAAQRWHGAEGKAALLGHSMATDIIIRAAEGRSDVGAIVAISSYSEAITPTFPERLLIISGAWEGRLRKAGFEALAQITDAPVDGQTARQGEVVRRSVSVPGTEHVAVLFSPVTARESLAWLQEALSFRRAGGEGTSGVLIAILLASVLVLTRPLARLFPVARSQPQPLSAAQFWTVAVFPAVPAGAIASQGTFPVLGIAGFGNLAAFFAVWGITALVLLWRWGRRPQRPDLSAAALLCLWAVGVFALALDRYFSSFVVTGPRLPVMALLLPGAILFAWADRLLVDQASLFQRLAARLVPVIALSVTMFFGHRDLALLFSVIPVLCLYLVVYGTMAQAFAARRGPDPAGLAMGFILAWSIAASTPLFQATGS